MMIMMHGLTLVAMVAALRATVNRHNVKYGEAFVNSFGILRSLTFSQPDNSSQIGGNTDDPHFAGMGGMGNGRNRWQNGRFLYTAVTSSSARNSGKLINR
jgi:hypothetical protein